MGPPFLFLFFSLKKSEFHAEMHDWVKKSFWEKRDLKEPNLWRKKKDSFGEKVCTAPTHTRNYVIRRERKVKVKKKECLNGEQESRNFFFLPSSPFFLSFNKHWWKWKLIVGDGSEKKSRQFNILASSDSLSAFFFSFLSSFRSFFFFSCLFFSFAFVWPRVFFWNMFAEWVPREKIYVFFFFLNTQ